MSRRPPESHTDMFAMLAPEETEEEQESRRQWRETRWQKLRHLLQTVREASRLPWREGLTPWTIQNDFRWLCESLMAPDEAAATNEQFQVEIRRLWAIEYAIECAEDEAAQRLSVNP